jgi:hypothetical protein
MNAAPAEPPVFAPPPPAASWGWKKFLLVFLLAVAAHLAFVFLFGAKKTPPRRTVKNVPVFHLADNASELVRLTDPTLFARPHAEDFPAGLMSVTPALAATEFHWTEAPPFLTNDVQSLGAAFRAFMQTNQLETPPLRFKPEPQLAAPAINLDPGLPQNSSWSLAGALAGRRVLNDVSAPSQSVNDVIAPSRVQLLVSPDGDVVSAVLVDDGEYAATDHYAPADQTALALTRTLRFAPADQLAFGEIIFNWHTVPTNAP